MVDSKYWIIKKILVPFGITRLLLLVVGYLSQYILPVFHEQTAIIRQSGYFFSNFRLLDIWARWDSGWYMYIIKNGYSRGDSFEIQSNLPFFPGFPALVKFFTFFVPASMLSDEIIVLIGVLSSNILLLVGLIFVYKIAQNLSDSKRVADLTVWYILVFPSSFFLSSFYTESLFLCLSALSYWWALKRRWLLACIALSLVVVTRNVGMFLIIPVFYEYLKSKRFSIRKINLSIVWFSVVPVGLLLFFWYLYTLTGDFLAAIKVQEAWGRFTSNPVSSLLFPTNFWIHITPVDQFFVISALVLCWKLYKDEVIKNSKVMAVFSLLLSVPTLFTGTLDSFIRYVLVVFPLFIYWAYVTKDSRRFTVGAIVVLLIVQLVYFGLFSQFYWVG